MTRPTDKNRRNLYIKQEWEGGLPPVHGDLACTSGGKCKVLGWDSEREQVAVQWHDGELGVVPLAALKPFKSPHERQRDELVDLLEPYCRGSYCGNEKAVADAILSKYNLEPKP